ncbi:hypothetical protein NIES2119_03360 [[Phormidium ambiguum] IAM M-71]|uniref:Uncharacterized protein n=1 Tax=[Phormidium ambiguum] IAM M-71 TaxID=454136 RepID=A0A1U7IRL0_9CYAN|nr:hypothetical protein [Phormidium ambiguum]OKH39999.1 hypothetical protein NIES2119_03360 [Phormidium ambiguum IAM M-71]
MNFRLIVFSSLTTALIGATIGLAVGGLYSPRFSSQIYRNIHRNYALVGGLGGLVIGGCQEVIRQLKKQRDEEETEGKRTEITEGRGK